MPDMSNQYTGKNASSLEQVSDEGDITTTTQDTTTTSAGNAEFYTSSPYRLYRVIKTPEKILEDFMSMLWLTSNKVDILDFIIRHLEKNPELITYISKNYHRSPLELALYFNQGNVLIQKIEKLLQIGCVLRSQYKNLLPTKDKANLEQNLENSTDQNLIYFNKRNAF